MDKIRCIAVDDEAYAADIIANYIQKVPYLELAGKTTNAIEALTWVQQGKADLVFLDIQMPELTGLQFLKIAGNNCKIILTTAYPEHALTAYENDVIDYLLKPVSFERFLRAVQKVQTLFNSSVADAKNIDKDEVTIDKDFMFIKGETKNKFIKISFNDINYIEGLKNYISIFLTEQRLVTYLTLKDVEPLLPEAKFMRVHKSYIVAMDKINMIDGNTIYINTEKIPIGETYKTKVHEFIRDNR